MNQSEPSKDQTKEKRKTWNFVSAVHSYSWLVHLGLCVYELAHCPSSIKSNKVCRYDVELIRIYDS